jgi:hypothetical protein
VASFTAQLEDSHLNTYQGLIRVQYAVLIVVYFCTHESTGNSTYKQVAQDKGDIPICLATLKEGQYPVVVVVGVVAKTVSRSEMCGKLFVG